MLRIGVASLVSIFVVGLCLTLNGADPTPPAKDKAPQKGANKDAAKDAGKNTFGLTKLHQVHIEVTQKDYDAMQPKGGGFPGGGFGGAQPPEKAPTKFGYEFPYAHAKVNFGDTELKDVGLRYKGNGSYMMSARMLKRSFKIDLDMYDDNARFDGMKKINLNSGVTDPTRAREILAYGVYRDAGVPAPRTALAEVRLSIPDKYKKELLGVYTVVEQIDKAFLQKHFGSSKGMLLKPEGLKGLEYFGDDWTLYEKRYLPKDEPTEKQKKRLMDFIKLVEQADDATFGKEIGNYLDIDAFTKFFATTAMVAAMDSILTLGHNYYLYLSPENNKFYFFPWDLDHTFGTFPIGGNATQQADLSIDHPHQGDNKLFDRLVAIKEHKETYRNQYKKLIEKAFTSEKILKENAEISKLIAPLLVNEKKASTDRKEFSFPSFGQPVNPDEALKTFVEKRVKSIEDQLAGKSKGHVPATGGFGGFNPPASPNANLAKAIFTSCDTNKDGKLDVTEWKASVKKLFDACDVEKKGKLKEDEFATNLEKILPQQAPGFGGGRPSNKPMATSISKALFAKLPKEANGILTVKELETISTDVLKMWDKGNNGLDEKELEIALFPLIPTAGGFGPPKGGFPPKN